MLHAVGLEAVEHAHLLKMAQEYLIHYICMPKVLCSSAERKDMHRGPDTNIAKLKHNVRRYDMSAGAAKDVWNSIDRIICHFAPPPSPTPPHPTFPISPVSTPSHIDIQQNRHITFAMQLMQHYYSGVVPLGCCVIQQGCKCDRCTTQTSSKDAAHSLLAGLSVGSTLSHGQIQMTHLVTLAYQVFVLIKHRENFLLMFCHDGLCILQGGALSGRLRSTA